MPDLDKDQHACCGLNTGTRAAELNFLVPNTELLTGSGVSSRTTTADRPRIDAWQTVVNGRLGLM